MTWLQDPTLKRLYKFRLSNKVFHPAFTYSKSAKKKTKKNTHTRKNNVSNIFKVSNKDTRRASGASVVHFELHSTVIIAEFEQINSSFRQ